MNIVKIPLLIGGTIWVYAMYRLTKFFLTNDITLGAFFFLFAAFALMIISAIFACEKWKSLSQ